MFADQSGGPSRFRARAVRRKDVAWPSAGSTVSMVIRTRVFGASAMGSVGWKPAPSNNASISLTIACLLFSIFSRFSHRHRVTASEPPNAALQAGGAAAATQERRLFPAACKQWFGPYAADTAI